ncbi:TonB-dependent receptor [Portibacter lacus]|uniref:TonB-dependent receptor n=1 Tax=Portibacter lacus TaxID=1099794 RepID=A0AA37WFQ5_9BACT|nr:TonB-dependent receptor [Portibacter lacus]GLR17100.1 TonB-dependent receptor [Portibacter lacus]
MESIKNQLIFFLLILSYSVAYSQTGQVKTVLTDNESMPVIYANAVLYNSVDSTITKIETSDDQGVVNFANIPYGRYYLEATYVGYNDLRKSNIDLNENQRIVDLGKLVFEASSVQLAEAVITANRVLVEIKPDRTVFNVEGTINSVGDNGMGLLRKAPGVLVDNNDNISVLSRSGVLIYVDGRRLPLSGDDLVAYLTNLPAEQIDRIDIITNPGAKYEAEGNAGIIDIRLKKDKNLGYNGSFGINASQGRYSVGGVNASGNYRNKKVNVFGTLGSGMGEKYHETNFINRQNNFILNENSLDLGTYNFTNYKVGTDFFITPKQTIGILVTGGTGHNNSNSTNTTDISSEQSAGKIDSILYAKNEGDANRNNINVNVNYAFSDKVQNVIVDFDYGIYNNNNNTLQPNQYFDPTSTNLLSEFNTAYETPVNIDILTFKVDYDHDLFGGKVGLGTKLSKVGTDNTFRFYNVENGSQVINNRRSNQFDYTENVYAAYLTYARPITKKLSVSAGVRSEITDATGNLQAFLPELQEPPVELNYTNHFPTVGLTYQINQMNTVSLNYGKRINRPDYNVLNPFNIQSSELSFRKGNPFLRPEIVNNLELGYSLFYRYNLKLSYSKTSDQITRLIAPDDTNPKAGFITWENLAEQELFSANISAPVDIKKWWNMYLNVNAAYIDNQADYGEGAIVDVQTFTYSIFQQSTFTLPAGFKGEISGYYSGPGVWGGVFKYGPTWSLNLGLQKIFLDDKLNMKLSMNDLFYKSGWSGKSEFNGLVSEGMGQWDSRKVALSLSYNFGNSNVKSRKRKTGIEEEANRVSN